MEQEVVEYSYIFECIGSFLVGAALALWYNFNFNKKGEKSLDRAIEISLQTDANLEKASVHLAESREIIETSKKISSLNEKILDMSEIISMKINKVTASYRHTETVPERLMVELCDYQIDLQDKLESVKSEMSEILKQQLEKD